LISCYAFVFGEKMKLEDQHRDEYPSCSVTICLPRILLYSTAFWQI